MQQQDFAYPDRDQGLDRCHGSGVESRGRLIEQQHFRSYDQGTDECESQPLASG
jgi:hypothetical protein